MGSIQIGGRQINYHVKAGRRVKYTYLKFTPDLELEIVLPHGSGIDVEALLKKKRTWIARKYAELSNRKCVFDGKRAMFKGRYYDLNVAPPKDRANVELQNGKITIYPKEHDEPFHLLEEWMTQATTELLMRELSPYASRFNITLGTVVVRNTKRWGYCSKTGALVFTWQLIALPDRLAEYVMFHELVHLSEFNHSRKFWTKLASICPDFRERQQALNLFCISQSAGFNTTDAVGPVALH